MLLNVVFKVRKKDHLAHLGWGDGEAIQAMPNENIFYKRLPSNGTEIIDSTDRTVLWDWDIYGANGTSLNLILSSF